MRFDIVTDPWITVEYIDGSIQKLSIYDTLADAPRIYKLVNPCAYSTAEFFLYSFLCGFLTAAYRLRSSDAQAQIFESGSFDMEQILDYVKAVQNKGLTFDIFDQEHPFLQVGNEVFEKICGKSEKKISDALVPVSKAFPGLEGRRGRMSTFYLPRNQKFANGTTLENSQTMPVDRYILNLIGVMVRQASTTSSYYHSISGNKPVLFYLLQGNNLFETLCLNMYPSDKTDIPLWEKEPNLDNLSVNAHSGWLSTMWLPCALYSPSETDNTLDQIKTIYFKAGLKPNNVTSANGEIAKKKAEDFNYEIWRAKNPFISSYTTQEADGIPPKTLARGFHLSGEFPIYLNCLEGYLENDSSNSPKIFRSKDGDDINPIVKILECKNKEIHLNIYAISVPYRTSPQAFHQKYQVLFRHWTYNPAKIDVLAQWLSFVTDVNQTVAVCLPQSWEKQKNNKHQNAECKYLCLRAGLTSQEEFKKLKQHASLSCDFAFLGNRCFVDHVNPVLESLNFDHHQALKDLLNIYTNMLMDNIVNNSRHSFEMYRLTSLLQQRLYQKLNDLTSQLNTPTQKLPANYEDEIEEE